MLMQYAIYMKRNEITIRKKEIVLRKSFNILNFLFGYMLNEVSFLTETLFFKNFGLKKQFLILL